MTHLRLPSSAGAMPDLAPSITRVRLVIEGTCRAPIDDVGIRSYLRELSDVCGMTLLLEPVTHRSDRYGWAGWVHWETSGAHFYAWEEPQLFFSVDVYTCKPFDVDRSVAFTGAFFDAVEVVAKVF
ncbi:MAG TPA: S-adenosylmethionine decarboxylase [Acidimicrobiales bacterium]|nr:S-adenosylmethionine decarboxylase [Acidimicrobiales bacterium]